MCFCRDLVYFVTVSHSGKYKQFWLQINKSENLLDNKTPMDPVTIKTSHRVFSDVPFRDSTRNYRST